MGWIPSTVYWSFLVRQAMFKPPFLGLFFTMGEQCCSKQGSLITWDASRLLCFPGYRFEWALVGTGSLQTDLGQWHPVVTSTFCFVPPSLSQYMVCKSERLLNEIVTCPQIEVHLKVWDKASFFVNPFMEKEQEKSVNKKKQTIWRNKGLLVIDTSYRYCSPIN